MKRLSFLWFGDIATALTHKVYFLIWRDFVARCFATILAFAPIFSAAPFRKMHGVRVGPTIPPGTPSAVVGWGEVLFFLVYRISRLRFHFNPFTINAHEQIPSETEWASLPQSASRFIWIDLYKIGPIKCWDDCRAVCPSVSDPWNTALRTGLKQDVPRVGL